MRCCVQNCFNDDSKKTNKSQGITFHKLPKHPDNSAAWIEAITRLGCRRNRCLVVCSEHFLPEDFDDTRPNQRRIKSGAVPTIMAPVTQEEFKMCRVCLATDVKIYDMKNYKLSEMFHNITGILDVDNKGTILQRVCWECAARLTAAAAFRDKALFSDALLKDLVHINKSDIATLKQNHTSLKSHLTIHSIFTSCDIACEITVAENIETDILPDDEADVKVRINEEDKEMKFERNEPFIEVPMKTEKESDPLAENDIPIEYGNSDTLPELTHFDDSFRSAEDDSDEEIEDTKPQINNNDKILRENSKSQFPVINSEGNIVLANDKDIKPTLVIKIEEESSSAEDSQSLAQISVSKPKQRKRSVVGASNGKRTIRNHKISDKLIGKIIAMKKNGLRNSAIAKETGLTTSSIIYWWRRYREDGYTCRGSAARNQSDTKQNKQYKQQHKYNNKCNPNEPGVEMGVCCDIVRQRLREAGLEHVLIEKPEENVKMGNKTSEYKAHRDKLKRRIIALKQKGLSARRIAYLLNTSRNTVIRWWYRWSNDGHTQNHKRTGRKRKTTPEEDQLMIERVMQEQTVHTASLAMELGISSRSLRRRLQVAGFKCMEKTAYVPVKADRSHKVDEELKQQIMLMKREGVSVTHIAKQFRVPRATIYQWWQRWCKENNMKVTSDNNTSTSTEQEQSCTEGANVEKCLQTPAVLSAQKSVWRKLPDVSLPPLSTLRWPPPHP